MAAMMMAATMSEGFSVGRAAFSLGWNNKKSATSLHTFASRSLGLRMVEPAIRIGHGFDIHRLAPLDVAGQGCVSA
eukprot:766088-Hanusia_phi.AAC.6